jgi:hypothetical protein
MKIWNIPSQAAQVAAQTPGLGKNPIARAGAPIALTSELVGNIAAGSGAVFPTIGLQPGNRTPYWIDEVRILIGVDRTSGSRQGAVPAALRLFFETGAYKVSRVPVPAMLFSQVYGIHEYIQGRPSVVGLQQGSDFYNYRWVLPKPLYMPAGDVLQCRVNRDLEFSPSAALLNVVLTYVGRACAPNEAPPAVRNVPWVAHYHYPYSSTYAEMNDEFRNPFLAPLVVQRLIARMVDRGSVIIEPFQHMVVPEGDSTFGGDETMGSFMLPGGGGGFGDDYVSVKIQDSLGYMIVPNMTPLGMVIEPSRSAWTFNRKLSAREQISIAFETTIAGGTRNFFDTFVSMVGFREEPV